MRMSVIPKLCFFFWCSFFVSVYVVSGLNSDGEVQLSLMKNLKVVPPLIKSNWDSSDSKPCSRQGIRCDDSKNNVEIPRNQLLEEAIPLICRLSSLEVLDLSNNQLRGLLPPCLGNFSKSLTVLKLQGNQFHGTIPQEFINGRNLDTLDLSDNQLTGTLPKSLANCENLTILDLGNNKINDTFPSWLGSLPKLQILVLRSNKFHGQIGHPQTNSSFSQLRILDLSSNNFTGILPLGYFPLFKSMMVKEDDTSTGYKGQYYQVSLKMLYKGREVTFITVLSIYKSIDLSNNSFHGEIPDSIGNLSDLIVLNLSCNSLTGRIPSSFGNLKQIESLDLSNNKLSGTIPTELITLTFLSSLDLSYNNLEGKIPQGLQFNTFTEDSFKGNLGLCGPPLSKICGDDESQHLPPSAVMENKDESESKSIIDWTILFFGFVCGVVNGVIIGNFIFRRKYKWFLLALEIVHLIPSK